MQVHSQLLAKVIVSLPVSVCACVSADSVWHARLTWKRLAKSTDQATDQPTIL